MNNTDKDEDWQRGYSAGLVAPGPIPSYLPCGFSAFNNGFIEGMMSRAGPDSSPGSNTLDLTPPPTPSGASDGVPLGGRRRAGADGA